MKKTNLIYLLFGALFTIPVLLHAVPATPFPIQRTLPDGSELTVYLKGDEFHSYFLSEDGFLIQEDEKGFFSYSTLDVNGEPQRTTVRVRPVPQRTNEELQLISTLKPFPEMRSKHSRMKAARVAQDASTPLKVYPRTGSPKSLVILVNYSDVSFVTPTPNKAFTDLLNKEGYSENGGTGSARDYFVTSSFGASSPEFVVVGPYTLPNTREYYGANESDGSDIRPRDMVVDACKAASNDGVDFSEYDTDNDGIVDNVFIYYAGHNEAEGAAKETVWPHRWQLASTLKLNGKQIIGYACTSELKGYKDSEMCGIGTFAHEFGHVYGLVDYYATNGAKHHTMSNWSIMDNGSYLNSGRTPPTYSAYDRFYLGWITPTILDSAQNVAMTDLKTTNQAYIITQSGTHNMNGYRPDPVEFFTLEYRSKTGWDAFLPNSGLLITRIVFNSDTWRSNSPNNNPDLMGVDVMEADGTASNTSLSGDVFPGSANVTSFNPKLRSGTQLNKPLTYIREENDSVYFRFMGGDNPPTINSTQDQLVEFSTTLGQTPPVQEFQLSGINLTGPVELYLYQKNHFEIRKAGDEQAAWVQSITLQQSEGALDTTTIQIRYNPTEASFNSFHYNYLFTKSTEANTWQTAILGKSARQVYVVPPVANSSTINSLDGFVASWNEVYDASGYYLTVYHTSEGSSTISEGFDNGLQLPAFWSGSYQSVLNNPAYAGDSVPAIEFKNSGDYIATETYPIAVNELSFFIRSIGENEGTVKVEAFNGTGWDAIDEIPVSFNLNTTKVYPITNPSHRKFKLSFTKGSSSVAIDDLSVRVEKQLAFVHKDEWVSDTEFNVKGIVPTYSYHYKVRASDKTLGPNNQLKYENITDFSNTVDVLMQGDDIVQFSSEDSGFRVYTDNNGLVRLALTDETLRGELVYVYNASGRLLTTISASGSIVTLQELSKNQLYIIRIADKALKILL